MRCRFATYRVRQAQDRLPPGGPLPAELIQRLKRLDDDRKLLANKTGISARYIIDRLRSESYILEPEQRIDPHHHAAPFMNDVARASQELPTVYDPHEAERLIRRLAQETPRLRTSVLQLALDEAPRIGEDFAKEMVAATPSAFDALPPPAGPPDFAEQCRLLERAMFVAARLGLADYMPPLVARFRRLLQPQQDRPVVRSLPFFAGRSFTSLVRESFRALRKLGLLEEIVGLSDEVAQALLQGRAVTALDAEWGERYTGALASLLMVAGEWHSLGRDALADGIIETARAVLLARPTWCDGNRIPLSRAVMDRTTLARAYALVLGQVPPGRAQQQLEELLAKLDGINDGFTTAGHYNVLQLQVVEAIVLAVVG
jgi:hypothetical protein